MSTQIAQLRKNLARHAGFTLVELLVVIGIVGLLISILLPAMTRARETAKMVACQSNMRQTYSCLMIYAHDNRQYLPSSVEFWPAKILRVDKARIANAGIFEPWEFCPSVPMGDPLSAMHGMNVYSFADPIKLVQIKGLAKVIYLCDTSAPEENAGTINNLSFKVKPRLDFVSFASYPFFRHKRRANVTFADGHIEALLESQIDRGATHQWAYWIK